MSDKTSSSAFGIKLSLDRFNALSDGVFAIVITILVLGIDIPENHSFSEEGLINFFIKLEPGFIAYFTSFLMVGLYWILHNSMFHFIKYTNRLLIWLNILFLLTLTLLPFVSKVKALYKYDFFVVVIFASAHILTCLILLIIWRYINRHPGLCVSKIHRVMKRKVAQRILITPAICLLAIGLAQLNIQIGTYFFITVLPTYFLFSYIDPIDTHDDLDQPSF